MLTKDTFLKLYKASFLIRAVDKKIEDGLRNNDFFALHYPVKGQELISASLGVNKQHGDKVISTYRCLGDLIGFGGSYYEYFAEIMGRKEGISGGKGGCMHLCSPENGLLATTGIVGGGLAIACGAALALPVNTDNIVFVTFGDGATTTGAYHESMNLAGLWQLPVLFVCINNNYALHTRLSRITANTSLHTKTASYGIHAFHTEVRTPDMLHTTISECAEYVRSGRGPAFLEISSPRLHGHMAGSSTEYMELPPEIEMDQVDSLVILRRKIVSLYNNESELLDIEHLTLREVSSAYDKALNAPFPRAQDLLSEVTGNIE
ncbi:thiamine pyrophosphate-dependent dehydrogenase E1 component subunit alpha [Photorhabdus heterorhabditis]|uniref:Thiamine pyrophosphate-dependent dehydrogenase E1 component subunit alpha n=1 Tax=Photorhabdus heterorhabditis TaxID=880156 RepID=A0A5B0WYL5_9GAMM|nr:thiamine pyrophosphate-dependent dehydrogenase E1 component subunit alpha [Photorhabdus heterorhabditis]KAA1192130.1 thiamine pyrophosphate-dependent dehydrogenase E1 component subunit alpha [Photorhabdus heterorhabditis]